MTVTIRNIALGAEIRRFRVDSGLGLGLQSDTLHGPLAQLVEHRTFNPMVDGSSPSRLINKTPAFAGVLLQLGRRLTALLQESAGQEESARKCCNALLGLA